MGILPDWKIEQYVKDGIIGIEPFNPEHVQPHSYDLTLGEGLKFPQTIYRGKIKYDYSCLPLQFPADFLHTFALGTTEEKITLPDNICAQVDGKSSLGRLGLCVHQTAGWIDAGFSGNITLELSSVSPVQLCMRKGMKIGQIIFFETESAQKPYGHPDRHSHYQNQRGTTEPHGIEDLYT